MAASLSRLLLLSLSISQCGNFLCGLPVLFLQLIRPPAGAFGPSSPHRPKMYAMLGSLSFFQGDQQAPLLLLLLLWLCVARIKDVQENPRPRTKTKTKPKKEGGVEGNEK